jgi:RHS repeat-associated protein
MPGQVTDSMQYDLEGRLTWRYESGVNAGLLHSETMQYDARGKLLLAVNNGVSQSRNWYSGTGMLVANDWQNLFGNLGHLSEESPSDPLGNVYRKRTSQYAGPVSENEYPVYVTRFTPGTSRVSSIIKREPPIRPYYWAPDSTVYQYDNAGNNTRRYQYVGRADGSTSWMIGQEVESRSYYGADGRLRAFQKYDVRPNGSGGWQMAGVWEEYRYDPMGRRVLVRTRGDGGMCNIDPWRCTSSTTRFVWAGDQLLWELKSAQGSLAAAAGGNVSYTHGGGIDRPLVITKNEVSVVPHQNWRGQFTMGTWGVNSGGSAGYRSDCTSSSQTGCLWIPWPGSRTNVRHALADTATIQNWFGGLVDGMRDASGQMYMRNRYYDPASGQFTQPDPTGLAGGLSLYGYASGDPIANEDPYGLASQCKQGREDCPYIMKPLVVTARARRLVDTEPVDFTNASDYRSMYPEHSVGPVSRRQPYDRAAYLRRKERHARHQRAYNACIEEYIDERIGGEALWESTWAVLGAAWEYAKTRAWRGALRGGVWGAAGGATKEAFELTVQADQYCGSLPEFNQPVPPGEYFYHD